jgi:predicted SAM-dependent methyltransferase
VHFDKRADLLGLDHSGSIDDLPFEDNSADIIYACHVLEHYDRNQTINVLKEWYSVLKPGGLLRLCVPDIEALCLVYRLTGDLTKILGPLYGRQDYAENTHYIGFDFATLTSALTSAGFVSIHRYDWRDTEHSDLDDYSQSYYPHLDKEGGILTSLNMEATKPNAR